jgi:hypothetical protein
MDNATHLPKCKHSEVNGPMEYYKIGGHRSWSKGVLQMHDWLCEVESNAIHSFFALFSHLANMTNDWCITVHSCYTDLYYSYRPDWDTYTPDGFPLSDEHG